MSTNNLSAQKFTLNPINRTKLRKNSTKTHIMTQNYTKMRIISTKYAIFGKIQYKITHNHGLNLTRVRKIRFGVERIIRCPIIKTHKNTHLALDIIIILVSHHIKSLHFDADRWPTFCSNRGFKNHEKKVVKIEKPSFLSR